MSKMMVGVAMLIAACATEPDVTTDKTEEVDGRVFVVFPSCASLQCPFAPSGNPLQWEPCNDFGPSTVCYCRNPAQPCGLHGTVIMWV